MSDWKQNLDAFFQTLGQPTFPSSNQVAQLRNEQAHKFIQGTVLPAFEELQVALARHGREVLVSTAHRGNIAASLRVRYEGRDELEYRVGVRRTAERAIPYVEIAAHPSWPRRFTRGALREGPQEYSVEDISQDEVIQHVLSAYQARMGPPS